MRRVFCVLLVVLTALLAGCWLPAQQNKPNNAEKSVKGLADVHIIYIKPMPGGFDQYLVGEILRRLPKGVTLTQNEAGADAVLQGAGQESSHGISRTVNQVFGVGGSASGAVEMVAQDGQILWATEKSDHTIPIYGTWREHGKSKVAARIAKDLTGALRKAEKRAKHRH